MRFSVLVAVAVATALLAVGCGDDDTPSSVGGTPDPSSTDRVASPTPRTPEDCGQVAFTPNSDNGAFRIQAVGVDCETATAVATAADGQTESFTQDGFECLGRADRSAQLPSVEWNCTRDDASITFTTS